MEDHVQLPQEFLHGFGKPSGISVFVKCVPENLSIGQRKTTTSLSNFGVYLRKIISIYNFQKLQRREFP